MLFPVIANYCSILKLAQKLKKQEIAVSVTYQHKILSRAFLREGLIRGFFVHKAKNKIIIELKYKNRGVPLILDIILLSSVGHSQTFRLNHLKKVSRDVLFLSTNKGLLSKVEASYFHVGGLLLFQVII